MTEHSTKQRGGNHKPQCSEYCAIVHCKCGRNAAHGSDQCHVCAAKESGPFAEHKDRLDKPIRKLTPKQKKKVWMARPSDDLEQMVDEYQASMKDEQLVSIRTTVEHRSGNRLMEELQDDMEQILLQYRVEARAIVDDLEDRIEERLTRFQHDLDAA
jgi:hypothetical protein